MGQSLKSHFIVAQQCECSLSDLQREATMLCCKVVVKTDVSKVPDTNEVPIKGSYCYSYAHPSTPAVSYSKNNHPSCQYYKTLALDRTTFKDIYLLVEILGNEKPLRRIAMNISNGEDIRTQASYMQCWLSVRGTAQLKALGRSSCEKHIKGVETDVVVFQAGRQASWQPQGR